MNTATKGLETTGPSDRRLAKRLDEIRLGPDPDHDRSALAGPQGHVPGRVVARRRGTDRARARRHPAVTRPRDERLGLAAGLVALAAGVGRILGQELPLIPVLLITLGIGLVIGAAARKNKKGTAGAPTAS